jgi:hypothetical protein
MGAFAWSVALSLCTLALIGASAPMAAQQVAVEQNDETYGCIICHADKRRAFQQGVHAERGIRCETCHGGDPGAIEIAPAHRGRFLGSPTKFEILNLCSECHSDPNEMRQFGLSADQLAEFRTSRHGQLLLGARDTNAPTCTDCHDAHLIRPVQDARSKSHPLNIPTMCAKCHQDEALMATYGEPTDQYERYRAGAHGKAVFEDRNFAAPTCIGCHGSHAALPPSVRQVTDVCGRCHVAIAQSFYAGPHAQAAGDPERFAGCLACHSNHGTQRVPYEQLDEFCATCHEPESNAYALAQAMEEEVLRARQELHLAEEALYEMAESGKPTDDEEFRMQAAITAFRQLAHAQHSVDLEEAEEYGRQVRSNTGVIRATAEAHAEERWEHGLLLIPVWFLALSAVAFARFKLREVQQEARRSDG